MNTDPHSPNDKPDPETGQENASSSEIPNSNSRTNEEADTAKKIDDFAKSVEDALKTGAKDAKKAFEEGLPKAKEDLSKGVHDIAYAVAYAAAFGGALLKEVTPDILSEGLREGCDAGHRAAEDVIRNRKERAERRSREEPETDSGSTDDPEGPILV